MPADIVVGDVYGLREKRSLLFVLDEYEGYLPGQPDQSLFLRRKASIVMATGGRRQTWIYLYNGQIRPYQHIKSGDYLHYLKSERNGLRAIQAL